MTFIKRQIRYFFFGSIVPFLCGLNKHIPLYCVQFLKYGKMFNGEKCIVAGTAPSLNKADLFRYKRSGYKIIGVNSIIRFLTEKEIKELIDIYVIQDVQVFERLELELQVLQRNSIPIFIGSPICYKYYSKVKHIGITFAVNLLDHYRLKYKIPYRTKFSNGSSGFVYDGYTVVYSAVQLAVYFGFGEVGILGVDANYNKNVQERNVIDIGKVDPTWETAGDRINYAFSVAFFACQLENISIYNLNKSGNLSTIPRR